MSSVMASIISKVFDEKVIGSSMTAGSSNGMGRPTAVLGSLTFPPEVDLEAILIRIAAKRAEPLNWRKSIVDLLKLLNLDYGLTARRQLAYELGYGGSMDDGGAMNMWLHREVMRKLAESPKALSGLRN